MTIVTSNFAGPGTYYGYVTVSGSIISSRFVIESRRNDGLRFYFESEDSVVSVKSFTDSHLNWVKHVVPKTEISDAITTYTSSIVNIELNMNIKFTYHVENDTFTFLWASSLPFPVVGVSGESGTLYKKYIKDASNISAPNVTISKDYFIHKSIFFTILVLILLAGIGWAGLTLNNYLFFY